ncbi:MAG: tyrosine-type recombinase/integrase [Bacteroidales bacterium]|nr:tyrosine-type recombinase/integrase [Bacteroidales bacterium]
MTLNTDNFLHYLEREKRYSAHTILAYHNDLQQFTDYLSDQYGIDEISVATAPMIRSWLAGAMQQGLSRTSINRKLSTLKSYFRYAGRRDPDLKNPMEKVGSLKKNKVLPVFVEEEGMNQLLDRSVFEPGFAGQRDRLMLEMLYTTGMRLSELIGLQHHDFDTEKNTIKVTGKGAKQRIVPVIQEVSDHYDDYCLEKEKEFGLSVSGHIFVTNKGSKIYPKFVYRLVNAYLSKVTTRSRKSPHVLRHTFATHMLNHGADLNAIKEILGHASLSATQVYTHNSIEKIKNVYKQAHPKA